MLVIIWVILYFVVDTYYLFTYNILPWRFDVDPSMDKSLIHYKMWDKITYPFPHFSVQ